MAGSDTELANSSSGEEEEEDLSSEASESEPETQTHPTINQPSPSKPRSKNPTSRYSPPPLKPLPRKRPATDPEPPETKKIKNDDNNNNNNNGEKGKDPKVLFQRLWSEENEIELIQGMIDYVKAKGKDPVADVNDFHEFVKESLHVDVNVTQVLTKSRRLKQKFRNNVARVDKSGKARSFSNPHEKKMYELSKSLWGGDGSNSNSLALTACNTKKVKVKVNVTPKTNKSHKEMGSGNGSVNEGEPKMVQPLRSCRGVDHVVSIGLPITDDVIMSKGLELLSGSKKAEMEESWKSLKMQELEHFLKKVEILKEQTEVVLNAIINSGAK